MSAQIYRSNIERYLYNLADIIRVNNSLNLTDQAIDAESLFCKLLNTSLGWHLSNANRKSKNQDSFDLEDTDQNLLIQVTANKAYARKKKSSLDSFTRRAAFPIKSRFIILFIANDIPPAVLTAQSYPLFTYEGWDLKILLINILSNNDTAAEFKPINTILQDELKPKIIIDPENLHKTNLIPPPKLALLPEGRLYIKRDQLLQQISEFAAGGNGLLVGGPGGGKTLLLLTLQRQYITRGIACNIIPVEDLTTADDDDIMEQLGGQGNWLKALMDIPLNPGHPKNLLVFDAFDTAKDPTLKTAVFKQIKKAIEKLSASWNILVSARLYEAIRSTNLINLFPAQNIQAPIKSRHFEIPLLELTEIRLSLRKGHLLTIFEKSNKNLQQLLRIPYYLQLFEQLVNNADGSSRKEIEAVETEEQLLSIFWNEKVNPDMLSSLFIERLARQLSVQLKHSSPRTQLISETNLATVDHLISNGILSASTATGSNISFSHNILLDYAISLYVIPSDISDFMDHFHGDERHWLLFRSSYIHFYSHLWRKDRNTFWQHYNHLTSLDSPLYRLFRQTTLNFVLGNIYQSSEDIETAFAKLLPDERTKSYRKLLEVLRYLNKAEVPSKEYHLLGYISRHLEDLFVWDAGFLISRAIDQALNSKHSSFAQLVADAAVNYMKFYLARRKIPLNKPLLDGNAVHWAVNNLCKTYKFNKPDVRLLLIDCLHILKEEEFPIQLFSHLADHIIFLSEQNISLAKKIFSSLYDHYENSDQITYLGNDVNLSLRSNRRQDFQSIHYFLERCFPTLLQQLPKNWIPVGNNIVNDYNLNEGYHSKNPKAILFKIGDVKAKIAPDYIHYDQHYDKENGPVSFITKTFAFLTETADRNEFVVIRELMAIMFKTAQAGALWRELMRFIARYPKPLRVEVFAVLSSPILLSSNNTTSAAGELITAAWSEFEATEQEQIRAAIASLQDTEMGKITDSLLRNIPGSGVMTTPKTQADSGSPFRKPDPEATGQPGKTAGPALSKEIVSLRAFNDKYDVNPDPGPQSEEYVSLFQAVDVLFKFRAADPSSSSFETIKDCDYEICRYCRIVSKEASVLTTELHQYIEVIATYYLLVPEYMTVVYQTGPLSGGVDGYSPTPRINAVKTLQQLVDTAKTDNIRERLFTLFNDNSHTIRRIALFSLIHFWRNDIEKFWTIVSERIRLEENPICLQHLLQTIAYDDIIQSNVTKVEFLAEEAVRILPRTEERLGDLFQSYAILLLRLRNNFNSDVAERLIYSNLGVNNLSGALAFIQISFVDPHVSDNNYESDSHLNERQFYLLKDIIEQHFSHLQGKTVAQLVNEDLQPVDNIVSNMYFTFVLGKREYSEVKISPERKKALYEHLKPIFSLIIAGSAKVEKGFMVAQTGYNLVRLLDHFLALDPAFILNILTFTVKYASVHSFTYGPSAFREIARITETILTDHAEILAESVNFQNLLIILDLFAETGWVEALELTWRIKDAFI